MRPPPPISDLPRFPVTGGTILLALGVTLAGWNHYDIGRLVANGEVRRGEIWRLLTSTLPHANVLHLVFNLYWTWIFGAILEEVYGHAQTLGIFVLFAMVSSGAQFALLDGGIGLSGIGYGLFGLLWVLSHRDRRFRNVIDRSTAGLFIAWFFLCILMTWLGMPVANVAHGAGLAAGALLGWTLTEKNLTRILGVSATALLLLAVMGADILWRPWVNFAKDRGRDEAILAYNALEANEYRDAVRWSLDAVRMNPRNAGYWNNLGIAYSDLDKPTEAQAAFQRSRELEAPFHHPQGF